jgi:tRNA 2-thiocytidine biosynthesis protein TtcA
MKFIIKEVNHLCGRAIHQNNLLKNNDKILIGFSGGYDSILMLYLINKWLSKAPINFQLTAVYLDMGFDYSNFENICGFLKNSGMSYIAEMTDYGVYAHSNKNRGKSPCFLCSLLRRKRLFELTKALGCNKLALGHNQDDVIETFFMNMTYSGELSAMVPRQEMFKGLLTIIRPLLYIPKHKIIKACDNLKITPFTNPCPSAGKTRREEIKQVLDGLYNSNKNARGNIFRALSNVRREYLL